MPETRFTRDQIFDKIQKLMAMADHPGTNENVAAAAAAKAQELMIQWAIDETELSKEKGENVVYKIGELPYLRRSRETWEDWLFGDVAKAFMTHPVHNDTEKVYKFGGRSSDVDIAMYMYDTLRKLLDRLSKEAFQAEAARIKREYGYSVYRESECRTYSNSHPTVFRAKWVQSWLLGARAAIAERFAAQKQQQTPVASTALVVVTKRYEEARDWMRGSIAITKAKARQPTTYTDAREQGYERGKQIEINPALTVDTHIKLKG